LKKVGTGKLFCERLNNKRNPRLNHESMLR
jgi:hypothetical protein